MLNFKKMQEKIFGEKLLGGFFIPDFFQKHNNL